MTNNNKVKLSTILKERKGRYKPSDPKIKDLKRIDKIDFQGNIYFSNNPSKTNMILVKKGDLVISGINVAKGAMAVYDGEENVKATIHYSSYTFDQNSIDIEYLKRFLKSEEFINELKDKVKGGIKTEIKPKHLLPIEITLPDINDQKTIVSQFIRTENKHKKLTNEITKQRTYIQKLRQQVLQEAIQGKLTEEWRRQTPDIESASELLKRIKAEKEKLVKEGKIKKSKPLPPIKEEEKPFELPEGWVWCRLGEVLLKLNDGTHNSPSNTYKGEYKYITAKNISLRGIELSNITYVTKEVHDSIYQRCNPEYGDILYVKDGATTGMVCINNLEEEFSLLSSVALMKPPTEVDNKYLLYTLRSPFYYNSLRSNMFGVAITRVTVKKLQNSIVPIPPLKEQKMIAYKLEKVIENCDNLTIQTEKNGRYADKLMQAVLREAFEG